MHAFKDLNISKHYIVYKYFKNFTFCLWITMNVIICRGIEEPQQAVNKQSDKGNNIHMHAWKLNQQICQNEAAKIFKIYVTTKSQVLLW